MAAKLAQFIAQVNAQMEGLTDPSQPEPSKEQLEKYASSVVATLQNLTSSAPPIVSERVAQSFGRHWDFHANKPGTEPMTALDLKACFVMMKDLLSKMPSTSGSGTGGKGKGQEEQGTGGKQPNKRFGGEKTSVVKPLVGEGLAGRIIGPGGSTLKTLELESQCKLEFLGDAIKVTGPSEGVEACIKAIDDIIEKGYTNLSYGDGFAEITFKMHPRLVPDVKGPEWSNFIAIRENLQVEIGIPDQGTKGEPKGKGKGKGQIKFATITIGGQNENVQKAKAVIDQLAKEFYHPMTHPGKISRQIQVDPWYMNAIIGSKGAEIRHMQKSFKVNVYIPNEINKNENVVVVGEEHLVARCVKHIEGLVYKMSSRPQRGEEQYEYDAEEDDGLDPYAAEYMYKRN